MLSLLRCFRSQNWRVVFASCAEPSPLSFPLETLDITTQSISVNDSSFDRWVTQLQPDIVVFDRFLMEEQFGWRVVQAVPNALKVLDTEDLQCLRYARSTAYKAGRELSDLDYTNDISLREIASILRCDLSLVISQFEYDLLQRQYKVDRSLLFYWPLQLQSGTELWPLAAEQSPDFEQRQGFAAIGNFRHAPNWDSVLYLRELWPQVRSRIPGARLYVYGAYMPPKARQLHNEKIGFHVDGWVDDARAALAKVRVCVAPLRFGAGQKGKLLLAMCAGTPSVTTSVGAEAMVSGPWPGRVADSASEFIDAMVSLHENSGQWHQAHQRGNDWLRELQQQRLNSGLTACIEGLVDRLEQHRTNNFVGAMLRHHHHQSTEYFSRWIETKNRLPDDGGN